MSEEEMKAVDYWKNYMEILHWNTQLASEHYMKVLLDLIEKQQIELNRLKEIEYKYNKALEDLVKLEKERQADKEKIKELNEGLDNSSSRVTALTRENTKLKHEVFNSIPKEKVIEALQDIEDYFDRLNGPDEDIEFIQSIKDDLLKDGGE